MNEHISADSQQELCKLIGYFFLPKTTKSGYFSPLKKQMSSFVPEPPTDVDGAKVAASIIGSIMSFAVIATIGICCARKAKETIVQELKSMVAVPPVQNVAQDYIALDAPTMEKFLAETKRPMRFTAQQLCTLTNNYSTRLGSGGFGIVYDGCFPNGDKIAVKVLTRSSDGSVESQFKAEVETIGRTHHINVVRLYGFCYDQYMSALIYEHMENGSLDKYLFSKTSQEIKWEKLHDIAVETAKGIAYLHDECHERIIHYDIKPGNILLDGNMSAKVADFGLAKLCNRDKTHVSVTGYRGTPGYSAPEFMLKNYPITHKCDVYSFGMVLFEIVGQRKNTIIGSTDSLDWFPKRVWDEYEKGTLIPLVLASGIEEKDREKAEAMSLVALWCVQDSPAERPTMSAVARMLEGGVEIVPPPKPFHYMYSMGMDALALNITQTSSGSDYQTSYGTNSQWYKETTPIMAKYEIEVATT